MVITLLFSPLPLSSLSHHFKPTDQLEVRGGEGTEVLWGGKVVLEIVVFAVQK